MSGLFLLLGAALGGAENGPVRFWAQVFATNRRQVFNVWAVLLWRTVELPLADRVVTVDLMTALIQLAHQRGLAARSINGAVQSRPGGDFSAMVHERPF
jgi:hypothetical protein